MPPKAKKRTGGSVGAVRRTYMTRLQAKLHGAMQPEESTAASRTPPQVQLASPACSSKISCHNIERLERDRSPLRSTERSKQSEIFEPNDSTDEDEESNSYSSSLPPHLQAMASLLAETTDRAMPMVDSVIRGGKLPLMHSTPHDGSQAFDSDTPPPAPAPLPAPSKDFRTVSAPSIATVNMEAEQMKSQKATTTSNIIGKRAEEHASNLCQGASFGLTEMVNMGADEGSNVDEVDSPAFVTVKSYRVKAAFASILRSILEKYGDIAVAYVMKTPEGRALALEGLCDVAQSLQSKSFCELDVEEIKRTHAFVDDFRKNGMDASWLQQRLEHMLEAKEMIKQSSTLKGRRDENNKTIKEKKQILEDCKSQMLALKGELNAAYAEARNIQEEISRYKDKVTYFISHPLLDNIL